MSLLPSKGFINYLLEYMSIKTLKKCCMQCEMKWYDDLIVLVNYYSLLSYNNLFYRDLREGQNLK